MVEMSQPINCLMYRYIRFLSMFCVFNLRGQICKAIERNMWSQIEMVIVLFKVKTRVRIKRKGIIEKLEDQNVLDPFGSFFSERVCLLKLHESRTFSSFR